VQSTSAAAYLVKQRRNNGSDVKEFDSATLGYKLMIKIGIKILDRTLSPSPTNQGFLHAPQA
jgi:hypothetical protein